MPRRATLKAAQVGQIFSPTVRPKTKYDVRYPCHTYRVPDDVHDAMKATAEERGIGLSELVRWTFCDLLKRLAGGDLVLPVEEYATTVRRLSE